MSEGEKTMLKILKVNVLALLSIPLLLVSMVAKLTAKTLEKGLLVIAVIIVVAILGVLNWFLQDPGGILWNAFDGLTTLMAFMLLFGGFVLLIMIPIYLGAMLVGAGAAIAGGAAVVVDVLLEVIHEFARNGYLRLFAICKADYLMLKETESGKHAFCVIWIFVSAVNRLLIMLLSRFKLVSVGGAVAACLCIFVLSLNGIRTTFGIGILEYLKLFSTLNYVFAIIYFLIALAALVAIIVAIGAEWAEWGTELSLATADFEEYQRRVACAAEQLGGETSEQHFVGESAEIEHCQEQIRLANEMQGELNDLSRQVSLALEFGGQSSESVLLQSDFAAYMSLLLEIQEFFQGTSGNVQVSEFKRRCAYSIKQAERKREIIRKLLLKIFAEGTKRKSTEATDFFRGCDTEEKVRQRYKALCKAYHPDVNGDEEMFKMIRNQYDTVMGNFSVK